MSSPTSGGPPATQGRALNLTQFCTNSSTEQSQANQSDLGRGLGLALEVQRRLVLGDDVQQHAGQNLLSRPQDQRFPHRRGKKFHFTIGVGQGGYNELLEILSGRKLGINNNN